MIPNDIEFHEADIESISCLGESITIKMNRFSDEKDDYVAYGAVHFDGVSRVVEEGVAVERIVPPFDDGELVYLQVKGDQTEFLITWRDHQAHTWRDVQYVVVAASVSWRDA